MGRDRTIASAASRPNELPPPRYTAPMKDRELSARLGALLRDLRKDRGLSQRAAAELVGAPQPKLSLLEAGRLDFGALALVVAVAEKLGVSPVEVLAAALGGSGAAGQVHARFDRPWLVVASRLLTSATGDGKRLALDPPRPFAGLDASTPLARWVAALVRSRAFGAGAGASSGHAGGWILPFAPALVRQACDDLEASDAGRALPTALRARITEEAQRFALVHELAPRPREALALADALAADHGLPELDYLRGVLHHQLGATPLVVKGCVQQALDRLEAAPANDPRADLVVAGLLEYLEVVADAGERTTGGDTPDSTARIDHATRLLDAAGFTQGRVQLEVRGAITRHERLRREAESADPRSPALRDARWQAEWQEVAATLARARAEYLAMELAMGAAYVEDWLARHHELGGDEARALELVEAAAASYRALGQRRWECSARIRAAYYRGRLAAAELGVEDDAEITRKLASGAAGERAMALLDASHTSLAATLAEPDVTPYERPLLEIHLALAAGRLAGLVALCGATRDRDRIATLASTYRAARDAALAHLDDEVDATDAMRRETLASFRSLERAFAVLRTGRSAGAAKGPRRAR